MTTDEPLQGVVRPGPAPADADRPEVLIRDETGTPVQVVVRLDDGSLVEITQASLETADALPAPDALYRPVPYEWSDQAAEFRLRQRLAFGGHLADPRSILRGLTRP